MEAARRLAEAEDLADAVAAEITPDNTYRKSWRVWTRFCAATRLPELEATRGALVAFVTWMLREGQQNGTGYAPSSASTHLAGAVVGLRRRGVHVLGDDQAAARSALEGLTVRLLQDGERRGRGKAPTGTVTGLRALSAPAPTPWLAPATRPWSSPASTTPPAPRTPPGSWSPTSPRRSAA
ncbi:hypothetical protein [Streptomyces diastaticus]|uniref:hypothetical protein n=1 Tax=Streptomyces diastaticus TaxID=1956 RepID=UPI0038223C2C